MKNALIALVLGFLGSTHLQAQVVVTALEKGQRAVSATNDIRCFRFATFEELQEVTVGMTLDVGDELIGIGSTSLELACPGGSLVKFSGRFRVLVTPPTGKDCHVNLLVGTANVSSDKPTGLTSGDTTLGTSGTIYSFRVGRSRQGIQQDCLVYEGSVDVKYPTADLIRLQSGRKMSYQGKGHPEWQRLETDDLRRASDLYARIELGKAQMAGSALPDYRAAFSRLASLYLNVLSQPELPEARLDLAMVQSAYRLPREALYHLQRAEQVTPPADTRQQARIALTKAVVYEQSGDRGRAVEQVSKAQRIDPQILNRRDLEQYKIDPRKLQVIKPDVVIEPERRRP